MSDSQISPADLHPRKKLELINTWISYADTGAGDPIAARFPAFDRQAA